MTRAIAAYERSTEVSPFNSKYDAFLTGKATLTPQESRGLKIFEREDKGNCAACHPSTSDKAGVPPLFTDFSYDNLGTPTLPQAKQPGKKRTRVPIDNGLGAIVKEMSKNGQFKVPTLRNIAKTAPYMHHSVFASLREVIDFYNTRDIDSKWPEPEVIDTINQDELGDLNLTDQDIDDLLAFLNTLTDGYRSDTK